MTLYHDYRPTELDEIVGNEAVVASVQKMFDKEEIPPAIMLAGPSGTGKTTIARIIAGFLGADGSNFKEINTADFRGVDTSRDLIKEARLKPINGDYRVFLMDECHSMTKDAQNAILKLLEEPPAHCRMILATTEPEKMMRTIATRCTRLDTSSLSEKQLVKLMKEVLEEEEEDVDSDTLILIAEGALGSARAALVMLEKVIGLDQETAEEAVRQEIAAMTVAIDLCRILIKPKVKWSVVAPILKALDEDPERVRRAVLGYCMNCLLSNSKIAPRAYLVMDCFSEPFYNTGKPGLVAACYAVVSGE